MHCAVINNLHMLRVFLILFLMFFQFSHASEYNLYSPDNYKMDKNADERILFILDFSNSMSEYLEGVEKVELMINTMARILPLIPPETSVGLRIYGHKSGITAMDACRASTLLVPVSKSGANAVENSLLSVRPKGMTPITYSLKQAVKNDFLGFSGQKRIILLTDGGENCDESPCEYAMELIKTRKDIHIDVIAFNINDEDDLAQLKCAALVTSGKFYTANTAAELMKNLSETVSARKDVDAKIITNY